MAAQSPADYDRILLPVFYFGAGTHGSQWTTGAGCVNIPNGQCLATPFSYTANYTGFRSRGNLTWHITPDAMLYYTFSQGYRPSAFNRLPGGRAGLPVECDAHRRCH